MPTHQDYIRRCITIAKNGLGTTRPNPMVGCVIVHNNTIISEGFTSPYGGNHAEVNAISAVKDKAILKQATIYVTLEPCSHYGKTPPCSDLIIASKIPKVVIGCIDDNEHVAGKGIKRLKAAGVDVIVGVLENECRTHHKRFFTFHNKKRPYIILKWAQTQDHFIAPTSKATKTPVWISNAYSRQLTHRWRAEEQAILVGTRTVLEDNPSLTVRDWTGTHPTRVVIDRSRKIAPNHAIFKTKAPTICIDDTHIDFTQPIAAQICQVLQKHSITSLIIEGGSTTLQSFIDENLWDEARVFTGPLQFASGTKAPVIQGTLQMETNLQADILKIYTNA